VFLRPPPPCAGPLSFLYQTKIHPHLDVFAKGLALIVTAAFEEARALLSMYGKAGPKWDPTSYSRGSVSSRMQDFLHNGFSVLIDAGADILKWANEHDPKFASSLIGQWIESGAPILQPLAITGMAGHPPLTSDEKLSWVISNRLVDYVGLKNETFALLAEVYGASIEKVRAEFLEQAEAAMNPEGEDYERYEFFNLLSWLHECAPECTRVTKKLHPIQERHSQWKVREHPDFNSWISGGAVQAEPDSPIPASQIAEMNIEALLAESARLADATHHVKVLLCSRNGNVQDVWRSCNPLASPILGFGRRPKQQYDSVSLAPLKGMDRAHAIFQPLCAVSA
jgi:hypothetical protein